MVYITPHFDHRICTASSSDRFSYKPLVRNNLCSVGVAGKLVSGYRD